MNKLEELQRQYSKLPNEIKQYKRWVGFWKTEHYIDGYDRPIPVKCPMNALTGRQASTTNPLTWSSFDLAILGCVKYGFDGIGFMLGNGIFGVDLDNHEPGAKPEEEFETLSQEFITSLNSYTEKSQSGKGYHIICKGTIPPGACRKEGTGVEMYDSSRYFAMTGDVVVDMPIEDRAEEVKALWNKYLKAEEIVRDRTVKNSDGSIHFASNFTESETYSFRQLDLSDEDIINRIKGSKNATDFIRLFVTGDISLNGNDHSAADLALCTILAFWCGKNKDQMDRIFRNSALMREKWDRKLGQTTYGDATLDKAIATTIDIYNPPKEKINLTLETVQANNIMAQNNESEKNIDDNGDPIVKNVAKSFKIYSLDDTGNAERFYDSFGHLFKYNCDNKCYMFWDNKTWRTDTEFYSKKYADVLIRFLKQEAKSYEQNIEENSEGKSEFEIKKQQNVLKEMLQNVNKLSNKNGKEAMLTELQHLHKIPARNHQFDTQPNLLNTLSGVVNLENGEIMPFDKKLMLSKNTNCKVSYEEPKVWLKFLHDIFKRENEEETEELITMTQKALGESLTGRTNKDKLFILYGEGSNGKSTFIQTVNNVFGEYGKTMNSALLIQNPNQAGSQSTEFALSSLLGARFVSTSETGEGKHLDEITIKQMTSGEEITAQFKYGQQFSFKPSFSPWMSTNNKPIIRATDYGTWRRVFFIPFLNTFKDEQKDINMPQKLAAEMPQILGWMIQGNVRLLKEDNGQLKKPKCVEEALADYKNEMNVLSAYLSQRCQDFAGYQTKASALYQDYKMWAKDNSEYLYSETKFGREMTKRGYTKQKTRNGIFYIGIKLFSDTRGHIFGSNEEDEE